MKTTARHSRVAYASYLFPIRVPSGDRQLRREAAEEPMMKFLHHVPKQPIGVKTFEKVQVLVIKSKYRKKLPGRYVLLRPFLSHSQKNPTGPYARSNSG